MPVTFVSFHLNDAIIELDMISKHSREYLT